MVRRSCSARSCALAAVGLPAHFDEPSERLDHLVESLLTTGVEGTRIALQLYGEAVPCGASRRWPDDLGVGSDLRDVLSTSALAACIGPITDEMAEAVGFGRRCVPERGRLGLLVRALSTDRHHRHRHLRVADRVVVVHGASVWAGTEHVLLTDLERLVFAVFADRRSAQRQRPRHCR